MTTFYDLISETRHHLMTAQPDRLNVLQTGITSSDMSLTLSYPSKGVAEGSTIAIGLEEMHVVNVSGETITVIRGFGASTPAAHATGTLVYINPPFSDYRIGKFINTTLDNLSSEQLFQIRNATLTSNVATQSYTLTGLTNFIDVWRVRFDSIGTANDWPVLRPDEYWVDQAANTTDFSTGVALFLRSSICSGRTIQVSYRAGFTHLTNLADDVLTVSGLHAEAHDLPPMYAALCMLAGREVKRSFLNSQPEPRRQEEVPPGAANQAMRPLVEMFYSRLDNEVARLKRKFPRAI